MDRVIRIGTRSSELAMWQANTVAKQLEHLECKTEIVKIDSIGDQVLDKPLYELGITGVFTRNLDVALLNGKIDIAVHSFKDVPTQLPMGIVQAAVLKRGDFSDLLVIKDDVNFFANDFATIATGSLRRKAQWLYRYPNHTITGLRGNVQTRLQKLEDNDWDGAIFATAGLKRLGLLPEKQKGLKLDWMIPAPAQGAVMVAAMGDDTEMLELLKEINHEETEICVGVEREFLRLLEGGCTAPIGAMAMIIKEDFKFKGALFSPDGKEKLEYSTDVPADRKDKIKYIAEKAATYILDKGGKKLMRPEISIEKEVKLYSTKTLSQDQAKLIDVNFQIDMSDFITVRDNRLKRNVVKNPIENVVFTSQNAVESLLNNFDKLELDFKNIYCVGRRTKRLIEKRIGKVAHVETSAEKLANYLVENVEEKSVTFFCGNLRRDDLPTILEKNNIVINEVECYKTALTPRKLESNYKGVLFYSPSAIDSYLKSNTCGETVAFCIGDTTAAKANEFFKNVEVAKVATVDSVLKLANNYFQE
ncbi:hydroxymethylbilane synthase [Lutibacter oricola]|uniref:Hydroxymethylbilane synthase n=1 Tax=Lutibacter oricola TaxID=762486 RepID=A0A1H3C2K7_9FLAO|nr:hydroxymethylbilane synthase [Lutibacter oricola]SDX48280.1 hydroxymethylbilane synthase [Lutibacter oricola]